jgi:ubiquinone biosynthesis protein
MKSIKQFFRLLYINHVLAKNGLDQLVVDIHLLSPFRFIIYFNPWNWFRSKKISRGEALRKSLEELGPLFVKFGQALSTRPDILPADIAAELCKLQDAVPPFASEKALEIIQATYGQTAFELFEEFDLTPLASASIAQVHAAKLKSGQDVVVKILRPGIEKIVQQDLSILSVIANFADRYWKESRRFKPKEVVAEFKQSMSNELNLQREAANGAQLRRNFRHSPLLYVPEIHWDYVRTNVLVMERIYGIPVTDSMRLRAHGVNIKKLAERGLEIFFTQVFRDCFFHADMHPGNIFVSLQHPEDPQYICVDFGIIGALNNTDKRYLAENLLAFFNRDYRQVAQLHIDSGWVASSTRVEQFESDIRMVCEPVFEKPLKDISFAHIILQLFKVARRFDMEVQPQLVLLQKTLLAVEGLGRQLYPDLDLSVTAKPFMEKWLRDQIGPKAFLRHCRENLPFVVEQLPYMPRLLFDVLEQMKKKDHCSDNSMNDPKKPGLINTSRRTTGFITGVMIAMSAIAELSYFNKLNQHDLTVVAVISALIAAFALVFTKA